ncbi:MAG: SIMPL domain-containing protein [Deltaproteobacteria bacterium]|nr:SIMPL domain-containing protein [Deltaproteobacteria bacterium]
MHFDRIASLRTPAFVTVAGLGLLAAWLACGAPPPAPARAATGSEPPTLRRIEVDAKATLELDADRTRLTLTVAEKRPRPKAAFAEVWKKRTSLLAALGRAGVASADITVSQVMLHPAWDRGKPDGFEAQLSVTALVRASDQLAQVMEAAVDAGVTTFHTKFESSTMTEKKKRVRQMALEAAQEKAQQIAQATGVTLGSLQVVTELSGSTSYWPWSGAEANVVNVTASERGEAGRPGTIPLSLTLRVAYAIR